MAESQRIADQLTRSLSGRAWHGSSLDELLQTVDAETAAAHPIGDAHSIWEIVLHLTAWTEVVHRRLLGERIDDLPAARDWPAVGRPSATAWREQRERLASATATLRDALLALADERLSEAPAGGRDSVYVHLHGLVQHNAYHGGQIAMLKKALDAGD